ncbi:MAG: type I-E CRISPR-associated endoribonuclease Cas2 [Clostridiales bacterium]|jgi:CRISPR-associated protein Cas2|nr:type I-E CRISPR-associated endoribonuclease Cas2 [Clostridiales bacterium]
MLVVTLTNCPVGLRGDLTKWLLEINSGVFVGQVSTRIREQIWNRIKDMCKNGSAVMVYSASGEQKLGFKVLGGAWEPIDFDGIKLMLRPSTQRLKNSGNLKPGFSNAAIRRRAKRKTAAKMNYPKDYVVIDLETTGLNLEEDEIIEIGALKIADNQITEKLNLLVFTAKQIPAKIEELTGISNTMLREHGLDLTSALLRLLAFTDQAPLVSHNVHFDFSLLRAACAQCGLPMPENRIIDTLSLSKRVVKGVRNYKLHTLTDYFQINHEDRHRSIGDCLAIKLLYEKLINLLEDNRENG